MPSDDCGFLDVQSNLSHTLTLQSHSLSRTHTLVELRDGIRWEEAWVHSCLDTPPPLRHADAGLSLSSPKVLHNKTR